MIRELEDGMIRTLSGFSPLKTVKSMGRDAIPQQYPLPGAFVFFVSERQISSAPRRVFEASFDVVLVLENLRNEKDAANDAYRILDEVRDLLTGQTFDIEGVGGLTCYAREIAGYKDGRISYALRFRTKLYLPIL